MSTEVKLGDKVRATRKPETHEGTVTWLSGNRGGFDLDRAVVYIDQDKFDVEILEATPKQVGDTVEGYEQYAAMPAGTVVKRSTQKDWWFKQSSGRWVSSDGGVSLEELFAKRTIVHVPSVES